MGFYWLCRTVMMVTVKTDAAGLYAVSSLVSLRSFLSGPCGQEKHDQLYDTLTLQAFMCYVGLCSQRVNRELAQTGTAPLPHWGSLLHWNGTHSSYWKLNQVTNSAWQLLYWHVGQKVAEKLELPWSPSSPRQSGSGHDRTWRWCRWTWDQSSQGHDGSSAPAETGRDRQVSVEDRSIALSSQSVIIIIINYILTLRRVSTLFLVPTTQPFTMTKSLVTSP